MAEIAHGGWTNRSLFQQIRKESLHYWFGAPFNKPMKLLSSIFKSLLFFKAYQINISQSWRNGRQIKILFWKSRTETWSHYRTWNQILSSFQPRHKRHLIILSAKLGTNDSQVICLLAPTKSKVILQLRALSSRFIPSLRKQQTLLFRLLKK